MLNYRKLLRFIVNYDGVHRHHHKAAEKESLRQKRNYMGYWEGQKVYYGKLHYIRKENKGVNSNFVDNCFIQRKSYMVFIQFEYNFLISQLYIFTCKIILQ